MKYLAMLLEEPWKSYLRLHLKLLCLECMDCLLQYYLFPKLLTQPPLDGQTVTDE